MLTSLGVVGTLALAACAGSATIESFIKGDWECSARESDDTFAWSASVGDGTWSMLAENELTKAMFGEELKGTWTMGFGDLDVAMEITEGNTRQFTAAGVGDADAPLPGDAGIDATWAYGDSDPDSLSIEVDGSSVRLTHQDSDPSFDPTVTTCTKK